MANYRFIFNRTRRLRSDGTGTVHLRVTANRKVKYINTGISVVPGEWSDSREGGSVVRSRFAVQYNQILQDVRSKIREYELECITAGRPFTIADIDRVMSVNRDDFIAFVRHEISTDTRLRWSTQRAHLSFLNVLEGSGIITSFADLTYSNLNRMEHHLRDVRNMAAVTIAKRHTMLHGYISRAIKQRLITPDKDPYLFFTRQKLPPTKRRYLSADELQRLTSKELHVDRLRTIRDYFLFSCYTGLAYADVKVLKQADIITDNGTSFIILSRQKTDGESIIPLLPQAVEILSAYRTTPDKPLFPLPTNQKLNAYLKEIQALCDIDTKLTFHVARHTFATTITLEKGVPIETVSRMLGHDSIKTTQIYAKITRRKIADDMKGLM